MFGKKIKLLGQKYLVFNLLCLIFLASSWSLLNFSFFRTHDYVHGVRIVEMQQALADGHFPVRWSKDLGFGLGMPLFEFYGPLPYYVGSLFYFLGFNLIWSTKFLFLIANLGTLIGAYLLGKEFFKNNKLAGLITSAAITLAPYRAVNLFIRGALGEAWGIMAMPWILYFLLKKNYLALTLSLVVLLLSHNLSTLMFLPFSLLVVIFLAARHVVRLKKAITAYVLAIGLSSFYLLPAFLEKNFTQIDTILSGYFYYSHHFLYIRQFFLPHWGYGGSAWGPNDEISFFLGWGQLLGLLITLMAFSPIIGENIWSVLRRQKFQISEAKQVGKFLLILFLFVSSLFFSIMKSKWLWDSLPLLNFIQFPWSFISVGLIFLGLLVAYPLILIKKKMFKLVYIWAIFLVLILGNFAYFRPEKFSRDMASLYYADVEKIRYGMSDVLRDYVPIQMDLDGEKLKTLHRDFVFPEHTEILINKTQQKLYKFNLNEEQIIEFPVAYFPGWQVEIDGKRIGSQASEKTGLLSASIPAGEHTVGIYFARTPIRQVADMISTIALIILVARYIVRLNKLE